MSETNQGLELNIPPQFHDRIQQLIATSEKLKMIRTHRPENQANITPESVLNAIIERGVAEVERDLSWRVARPANNVMRVDRVYDIPNMLIIHGEKFTYGVPENDARCYIPKLDLEIILIRAIDAEAGVGCVIKPLDGSITGTERSELVARLSEALPFDIELSQPMPEVIAFLHDCGPMKGQFPVWVFASMLCDEIRDGDSQSMCAGLADFGIGYSVYHALTHRHATLPIGMQIRLLEESELWDEVITRLRKWRKASSDAGQLSLAGVMDDPVIITLRRTKRIHRFRFDLEKAKITPLLKENSDKAKATLEFRPKN